MEAPGGGDQKDKLLKIIEESLANGETNKALDALRNPENASCIESSAWDLIPVIVKGLSNSDRIISLHAQEILMALVELANPEEMLLELIEKAESARKDSCFLALLPAMQRTLSRMPEKRGRSLQWCLNTISQYLTAADHSDESGASDSEEEHEKVDEEKAKTAEGTITLYRAALDFCNPFIEEVSLKSPQKSYDKRVVIQRERQRRVLLTFLLQSLGHSSANVNLLMNKETKSPCRLLAEDIVDGLCNLCSDFLFFLTYMEERSNTAQNLKAKDIDQTWEDINPFLYEDVVPITGLGVLYYLVLVEGVRVEYAPCVYSTLFIFQSILHVALGMILFKEDNTVFKGLKIVEIALKRLGRAPLSADIFDDPIQSKFCIAVIETIFGSADLTARSAVSVFKTYLTSFSHKGQYQLLKNLFSAVSQQGPKGFLVTQLKDSVDRSLKEHMNEEGVDIFRGNSLFSLIKYVCGLPDGLETDVADHADHIIATLNLVWYLVLCKDSDKLGISSHVEWFEDSLMETLGEAVAKCRAKCEQYKMSLKNCKEQPGCSLQDGFFGQENKLQAAETTINKLILIDTLLTDVDKAMNRWRGVGVACLRRANFKRHGFSSRECARSLFTSRRRALRRCNQLASSQQNHNDSSGENSDASSANESDYDKEISDRILQASLPFVHQYGWSNEAISQGAETLGYSGVVHGMFPRGGYDLVNFFSLSCNEQLVEFLKKQAEDHERAQKVPTIEKVEDAVRTRLEMIIPYMSQWPEAVALSALPHNIPNSLAALLTMVDDVCHFCGDKSVDLTWYSRRVGLASIYKAAELYIIQDKSPEYESTWRFLKLRLNEGKQIDRLITAGAGEGSKMAVEALRASFSTARNILRLNR